MGATKSLIGTAAVCAVLGVLAVGAMAAAPSGVFLLAAGVFLSLAGVAVVGLMVLSGVAELINQSRELDERRGLSDRVGLPATAENGRTDEG